MPFDSTEKLTTKRQRLVDQRLQQQPSVNELLANKGHNNTTLTLNPSFHTKTEFQHTSNHTGGFSGGQNGFPLMHKLSSPSDAPVSQSKEQEPKVSSQQPPQSDCTHQQLSNSQHKKKKSKKHKGKERERLKDDKGQWTERSPDLKQDLNKLDSKTLLWLLFTSTSSVSEMSSITFWTPCLFNYMHCPAQSNLQNTLL